MLVDDCGLVQLPKVSDPRGNLTFIEGRSHIPFDIGRVFYLYDVPKVPGAGATHTRSFTNSSLRWRAASMWLSTMGKTRGACISVARIRLARAADGLGGPGQFLQWYRLHGAGIRPL